MVWLIKETHGKDPFRLFGKAPVALNLERMGLGGTFRVAETENSFSAMEGGTVTLTLKEDG